MGEYYPKVGACYDEVRETEKIFLIYTYKCNASCSHCLTESNPQRAEKIPVETAKALVSEGRRWGKRWLMISGGEPFLYFEEIVDLVSHARDQGFYVCAGTNAFWAKDEESTREKVGRLKEAGLRALFPSATSYHSPYVPTDRVRLLDKICQEFGLLCEINFYPSPDNDQDRRIQKMLGLDQRVWYTDGLILTGNDVTSLLPLFPRRKPAELDDCGSVHMAITPHGDVICNCNVTYRSTEFYGTPFYLGNFHQTPFGELIQAQYTSPVLRLLTEQHHERVHQILSEDPRVRDRYLAVHAGKGYYSITEYYLDVFRDAEYLAVIEEAGAASLVPLEAAPLPAMPQMS
jgi:hypothetical protein